jgi:hypothetical protein
MCESTVFLVACEYAYTDFCFKECKVHSRGCATRPYTSSSGKGKTDP